MPPAFRLLLISDEHNFPGKLECFLREVLATSDSSSFRNVAVQIREKHYHPKELTEWLNRLKHLAGGSWPLSVFLNDRADIACNLDFDGVQLTERSPPLSTLHPLLRQRLMVGVSTHDSGGLCCAEKNGADFALLSPVYPTQSKPQAPALGEKEFIRLVESVRLPVFALGGITPERATRCIQQGAYGVAVRSAIWEQASPARAVRTFEQAIERGRMTSRFDFRRSPSN